MWQCTPLMCAKADKPVVGKESPAFQRQAFIVEQLKAVLDGGPEQLVSVALLEVVSVHAPYQH